MIPLKFTAGPKVPGKPACKPGAPRLHNILHLSLSLSIYIYMCNTYMHIYIYIYIYTCGRGKRTKIF